MTNQELLQTLGNMRQTPVHLKGTAAGSGNLSQKAPPPSELGFSWTFFLSFGAICPISSDYSEEETELRQTK
jgi:hypothetical protein